MYILGNFVWTIMRTIIGASVNKLPLRKARMSAHAANAATIGVCVRQRVSSGSDDRFVAIAYNYGALATYNLHCLHAYRRFLYIY